MDLTELQERIKDIAKRAVSDRTVGANQIGSAVGSPGQAMQKRLQEMFALVLPDYDFSRLLVMDVADLTVTGPDTGFNVGLSLPVATDTWYLTVGASILPFQGENYQENAEKILGFLAAYLARLDNIKPLKSIQQYSDIRGHYTWQDARTIFEADRAPWVIREMRFETWMLNRSTQFPSKGPKASIEGWCEKHTGDKPGAALCRAPVVSGWAAGCHGSPVHILREHGRHAEK